MFFNYQKEAKSNSDQPLLPPKIIVPGPEAGIILSHRASQLIQKYYFDRAPDDALQGQKIQLLSLHY